MDNLVDFLRKTADNIESGSANVKLNMEAIEFYAKNNMELDDDTREQDIYKYISLGWYIYQHLENKND